MPIDVVWGRVNNRLAATALVEELETLNIEGTLYLGYPVLPQAESTTTVEALLVSKEPGLVAFNFPTGRYSLDVLKSSQDSLAYAIEGNLQKHEALRCGRKLGITVNTISFFSDPSLLEGLNTEDPYMVASQGTLEDCLDKCAAVPDALIKSLSAAIQRVIMIKPVKRRDNVRKSDSRGAIIKKMEKEIANLDEWQRKAAIETPEGPQRVRGLAGSGKTVVLALKAAYLHSQHPEWDIAITFYSRALFQQFRDLIERFSLEHSGDKPNWEKIRVLHSWGAAGEPGIYSLIAGALNVPPANFGNARSRYGREKAFAGICGELLTYADKTPPVLFDAVLIDEAQDLPVEFLRLVFAATRDPKRIVWAYDELQNLSNLQLPSVEALFRGQVTINNIRNAAQQDIILPVCYRNTPWALTLAHALGFGIYRKSGFVQLFKELELWREIGYQVQGGRLDFGESVSLKRRDDSYPSYFTELLKIEDTILAQSFHSEVDQYEFLAEQIERNIREDELDPDDILIVLPNPITAKTEFLTLSTSLSRRGIDSHLAGVTSSRDVFAIPGSVTVSQIFRAKGNEAPMVYVVNANYCTNGPDLKSLRNTLFTAITRSRAWVRIYGIGAAMDELICEIDSVYKTDFQLNFKIPTEVELISIPLIDRDKTPEEMADIAAIEKQLDDLLERIENGGMTPSLAKKLRRLQTRLLDYESIVEE